MNQLYIITGKGGVGKTTFSMALTKSLQQQNKNVFYSSFDQPVNKILAKKCHIPFIEFDSKKSAEEYMAAKLGSQTIAKWIMKTPFFSSLINILPGLKHMILLGHIIDKLNSDPELIIIIDSPSSGHAQTLFKSSYNFKEVFQKGLIVKDIEKMHCFINDPHFLKVFILTLPTLMATQEALELKKYLKDMGLSIGPLMINDLLSEHPSIKESLNENLPSFISKKVELELSAIKDLENKKLFPHINDSQPEEIISSLASLIEKIL